MKDRRSVRLYRKKKEKELLEMYRRYDELRNLARKPESVEVLEKPIKVGYTRTFVLNSIGKNQKKSAAIIEALEACNTVQFSRTRDFKDIIYSPHYSSIGSWSGFDKENNELKLHEISDHQYEKLSEDAKLLFVKDEKGFNAWAGRTVYHYQPEFIKRSWLNISIKPHYITELNKYNEEYESERDKLHNKLNSNGYLPKIYHMLWGTANTDSWYKAKRKFDKRGERKRENDLLRKF